MFGNERKTIGVFVTKIFAEFQQNICRGISTQAKKLGYNVAFFTKFVQRRESLFDHGESKISELPDYKSLHGIILVYSERLPTEFELNVKRQIEENATCPVITIRGEDDGYYNVSVNNDTILEEIIRHFIEHHKYKKINFLAGPKGFPDSDMRLDNFLKLMKEYGLPVEKKQIYYGDFWMSEAYNAAMEWMMNPEDRPEAIICANDYMALTLCRALYKMGYNIPEDVAVSGCDNIERGKDLIPSMTTVGQPLYEMGVKAVKKIYKHHNKISQEKTTYLLGETFIRESCGCKVEQDKREITERRNRILFDIDEKDIELVSNARMSINLTGATNLKELNQRIYSHPYIKGGHFSYYICLFKDWDTTAKNGERLDLHKGRVSLEVGLKDGQRLDKTKFNRKYLLPPMYIDDEPQCFIFNMLHHQNRCFGYAAVDFFDPRAYKAAYQGWTINISNALENIRNHKEKERLVYELEDLYVKDVMTGIYNRRGLSIGSKYLKKSAEMGTNLLVFSTDIDNLKEINDNYGHSSGDIAIKTVASALTHSSKDDEINIRMGGDEFAVIGMGYNEDKLEEFINSFEGYIKDTNNQENHGFNINISYGFYMTIPDEDTSLEECISIADARMYEQKNNKSYKREQRKGKE